MTGTRRDLLKGAGALAFTVAGVECWLTPREAHAAKASFRVLGGAEIRALEAFGEVLVPGAVESGLSHFVDHHLAAAPADSLLMLRYLDIPPPYADFYRAGLAALDKASTAAHGRVFADLPPAAANELVTTLGRSSPPGWQGPPSPLFFFIVRSDAVDVVYGTPEGFEKLGVPYMPHIMPPSNW